MLRHDSLARSRGGAQSGRGDRAESRTVRGKAPREEPEPADRRPGDRLGPGRAPARELFLVPFRQRDGSLSAHGQPDRGRAAVEPVHRSGQGFHPLDPARRPNHFGPSGPCRHLYPSLPVGSAGCGDDRRERDLAGVRRGKTNLCRPDRPDDGRGRRGKPGSGRGPNADAARRELFRVAAGHERG